jgi:hypothetical protein
MVRSAGGAATLMSRDEGYAQIRLPSGEIRKINEEVLRDHRSGRQHRARERDSWAKLVARVIAVIAADNARYGA